MWNTRFVRSLLALGSAGLFLLLFFTFMDPLLALAQQDLSLENSRVRLVFHAEGGSTGPGPGLSLSAIEVVDPSALSSSRGAFRFPVLLDDLWSLRLRTPEGEIFTLSPKSAHYVFHIHSDVGGVTRTLTAVWEFLTPIEWSGEGDATVTVTVALGPDSPYAYWYIAVDNRFPGLALYDADFPRLTLAPVGDPQTNRAVIPYSGGRLIFDPIHSSLQLSPEEPPLFPSPHFFAPLQLFTYYDEQEGYALYLATHDGQGFSKRFDFRSDGENLHFEVRHYPAWNITPGNDYRSPYPVVTGAISGDWYDVAQVYREWALKQVWASRGPIAFSDKFSSKLKRTDIMGIWTPFEGVRCPFIATADDMERWAQFLGSKHVAGLWYHWRQEPFASGWPEYEPVRPTYPDGITHTHTLGNFMWPYVAASGWDTSIRSFTETHAADYALRDENGAIQTIGTSLALMDVATSFWQTYVRDWIAEMQQKYHIDGVYLDVWSGDGFALDYSTNHGHPQGGGNYFAQGMRKEARMIRAATWARDPGFVMMSEHPGETYIDLLDIENIEYLGPENRLLWWAVPLFGVVYHDYIMASTFSNITPDFPDAQENVDAISYGWAVRYVFGNLLAVNGGPTGVLHDPVEDTPNYPAFRFFRTLVRTYDYARPYLLYGQRLRDLELHVDKVPPPVTVLNNGLRVPVTFAPYEYMQPAVYASSWRSVTDGSVAFVFANWTGITRTISYTLTPEVYDLPPRGNVLFRLDEKGAHRLQYVDGPTSRTEVLPPRSVLILAVASCPPPASYPGPFSLPACSQYVPVVSRMAGDLGTFQRFYAP